MSDNKINQPLILTLLVFIALYIISFIPVEGELWGVQLKQIDLFSEFKAEDDLWQEDFFDKWDKTEKDSSDQSETLLKQSNTDVMLSQISFMNVISKNSQEFVTDELDKIDRFQNTPAQAGGKSPISGNTSQMKYFFESLKSAKNKKVRIAHYGDSQIEGDLITSDLRETLRDQFGGTGCGYLALTSQDISFRITTKQEYKESDWNTGSVVSGNELNLPYGISGESFMPKKNAWVYFEPTKRYRTSSKFKEAYLIYSDVKDDEITYSLDKKGKEKLKLVRGNGFQQSVITADKSARSIRLEFPTEKQAIFYGAFLEDGNGIYVDNIPLRGNSGEDLDKISDQTLKDLGKIRDYKLVIFQFGKNAISGNYERYEKQMVRAINNFKKAMPNTSFLLISVQDSGFKTNARILNLLKAQMEIAKQADIAFWNLYEAMGGQNSMSKWVKHNPPLASADHTHFNLQGAEIVGKMMAEAILDLYKEAK